MWPTLGSRTAKDQNRSLNTLSPRTGDDHSAVLFTLRCGLTFGDGRDHEDVDERGAVTLTHQGHAVWVTAERPDVLLDPVESGDEVEDGVVARCAAVLRAQKTLARTIDIE